MRMARRHVYTGMYTRHHRRPQNGIAHRSHQATIKSLRRLVHIVSQYIWTGYNMMNGNYLALATVIAVVLLSFLVPDISQKIHATKELNNMKQVVNMMTKEVNRAEVACLTAADEICYLHCSMQDGATETPRYLPDLSICAGRCVRPTTSEPVKIEGEINMFQRLFFPNRSTSNKEITIMSYVYTDSFNAEETMTNRSVLTE